MLAISAARLVQGLATELLRGVLEERGVCEAHDDCLARSVTVRVVVEWDPNLGEEVVVARALCLGHAMVEDSVVRIQDSAGS